MMIPLVLSINVLTKSRRRVRLWLPLFLLWLILLPFALIGCLLLFLVGLLMYPLGRGKRMIVGPIAFMRVLCSLRGLKVDVNSENNKVYVAFK